VSATTRARISRPRAELFEQFIPIELPRILLGYGPVPAVVSTTDPERSVGPAGLQQDRAPRRREHRPRAGDRL
jgi:hypothetical protein